MTLDEFQTRLRLICDAHVAAARAASSAYDAALQVLSDKVGTAWDANLEAFATIMQAELRRMLAEMNP